MKTVTQILFTILIALLMLAGCASKPSPNLCPTVCDGLVAYYLSTATPPTNLEMAKMAR